MLRLSTNLMNTNGINAILDQQAKLQHTQLQLSSGNQMLTPSDDPAASASTVDLDQSLARYQQYQKNADAADSRLQLEESSLVSVTNVLQRARELAVQANNASLSSSDRLSLSSEVDGLLQSVVSSANTKDANGDYIFAGDKGQTQPVVDAGGGTYTYQGDQGQRQLQIGASRTVADSDNGIDVFMNLQNSSGNIQSMFTTLYNFKTELDNNTPSGDTITNIDNALNNVSEIRARIGARQNAIDQEKSANDSMILDTQTTRSDLNDLDYASAVGKLNTQMAGLQAAQQTYQKVQGLSLFNYL